MRWRFNVNIIRMRITYLECVPRVSALVLFIVALFIYEILLVKGTAQKNSKILVPILR